MLVWPSGLRRSVLNRMLFVLLVGSNSVAGATNQKQAVDSAVHPSDVGK